MITAKAIIECAKIKYVKLVKNPKYKNAKTPISLNTSTLLAYVFPSSIKEFEIAKVMTSAATDHISV